MSRNFYFAALLALLSLGSCQEANPEPDFSGLENISYSMLDSYGTAGSGFDVRISPNPFFWDVNIQVHNPAGNRAVIFLSDDKGKYSKRVELPDANQNYVRFDFKDMPKGVYICEIQQEGKVDRYRLVKAQ